MIRFEGGSMAYVDTNLLQGETIVYRGRIHWIALAPGLVTGAILDVLACVFLVAAFAWHGPKGIFTVPLVCAAAAFAVAGLAWTTLWFIRRKATEIAVTNRRVLVKTGIVARHTKEILLSKVESVSIEESPAGLALNFGKVTIHGTGGTPEVFDRIADPNEFRRQIQGQIEASTVMRIERIA